MIALFMVIVFDFNYTPVEMTKKPQSKLLMRLPRECVTNRAHISKCAQFLLFAVKNKLQKCSKFSSRFCNYVYVCTWHQVQTCRKFKCSSILNDWCYFQTHLLGTRWFFCYVMNEKISLKINFEALTLAAIFKRFFSSSFSFSLQRLYVCMAVVSPTMSVKRSINTQKFGFSVWMRVKSMPNRARHWIQAMTMTMAATTRLVKHHTNPFWKQYYIISKWPKFRTNFSFLSSFADYSRSHIISVWDPWSDRKG